MQDNDSLVGTKIKAVPKEEKNIGIDTENTLMSNIASAAINSSLNLADIENFFTVAQTRESYYQLIDSMKQDNIVQAVIEAYANNVTEPNDNGDIIWVESEDPNALKYITYLLKSLQINKNAYNWVSSMITYGDLYLKPFRQSEMDDDDFFDDEQISRREKLNEALNGNDSAVEQDNQQLNENIVVSVSEKDDHFTNYVEMVSNPGEMFELTRRGKTRGFIKAPYTVYQTYLTSDMQNRNLFNTYNYNVAKNDITIYQATDYVHGLMEDGDNRIEEKVNIFNSTKDLESEDGGYSYNVKRGKSMLYDWFKSWREMTLLENAIILNRLTKSSIVRIIQVEVGDMPKSMISSHLQSIKSMMEQKSAVNVGKEMSEYTNPGPIENNIYIPTHNGIGNLSIANVGGDFDPKQLTDLEYFRDRFFGATGIPKQFFGFTEDGAGFNGGESLTIISSQFAKRVKKIQKDFIAVIEDLVNILLWDRGLKSYINKFKLKMTTPVSRDEIDKRDAQTSAIGKLRDTMDVLSDISDVPTRLKIIKSLLQDFTTDPDILGYIQDEIDRLELEGSTNEETNNNDRVGGNNSPMPSREQSLSNIENNLFGNEENTNETNNEVNNETNEVETNNEQDDYLPSFSELGVNSNDIEEQ